MASVPSFMPEVNTILVLPPSEYNRHFDTAP